MACKWFDRGGIFGTTVLVIRVTVPHVEVGVRSWDLEQEVLFFSKVAFGTVARALDLLSLLPMFILSGLGFGLPTRYLALYTGAPSIYWLGFVKRTLFAYDTTKELRL